MVGKREKCDVMEKVKDYVLPKSVNTGFYNLLYDYFNERGKTNKNASLSGDDDTGLLVFVSHQVVVDTAQIENKEAYAPQITLEGSKVVVQVPSTW